MPRPSHPPWLDHPNYTWRRVQVMKLLIMLFSATSCHFISLRSKYSPQQSTFLPWCQRPSFTPIHKHRQNYSFVHSHHSYENLNQFSRLGQDVDYTDGGFHGCPQSLQQNSETVPLCASWPLPSISCPIHYHPIIRRNVLQVLTASLNKL
jgi:hypothetical protein